MRVWEKSAEAVVAGKCGKPHGAKGRRITKQTILTVSTTGREVFRNERTRQLRPLFGRRASGEPVDSGGKRAGGIRVPSWAKEETEGVE
jgi:hypothetical protein